MPSFKNFSKSTTCHGFSHLIQAKHICSKVLWTLLLVVALSLMMLNFVGLVTDYLDADKQWTTTVQMQRTTGFEHPTITICNFNRVKKSLALQYGFSDDKLRYFFSQFWSHYPITINYNAKESADQYTQWRRSQGWQFKSILDTMSFSCDEMVIVFNIAEANITTLYPCQPNSNDPYRIIPVYTTEFGRCYQIQVNQSVIKFSGTQYATSLILDANSHEYLDLVDYNFLDVGFAIQINYGGRVETGNWLTISTGVHTWIGMSQIKSIMQTDKSNGIIMLYPPCRANATLLGLPDEYYTVDLCWWDCEQYFIAEYYCKCYPLIETTKYPMCEIETWDICYKAFQADKEKFANHIEKCRTGCEEPCEYKKVTTTISNTKLLTPEQNVNLAKLFDNYIPAEQLQNRLSAVDLFYKSMGIQVILHQERVSIPELLSNMGGNLGLTCGISCLTIIHAITYCCYAFQYCCKRKKVSDDSEN